MPWTNLYANGWRIVGMNHYNLGGKVHLFCSMTKGERCITAESTNEADVFDELEHKARIDW